MKPPKILHWFIYPLFFLACARQTTPTGGPKDSIPPSLIKSLPAHQQTNYNKQTLDLTFNEQVILNNPKEQIIITPSIGKEYDIEVKKNTINIRIKENLQPNTTYSVNFREAIQDITEKNPAENLKIAFSTGDYIDSLSIAGTVYELLKSTPTKDATVALFIPDTFNIFKHKPTYITKTNDKGKFLIENLKPGNYRIYTMDDKNKNLVVDSKSESFGFLSGTIHLDSVLSNVNIPTIRLDTRPLTLTSARPSATTFVLKTSKPIRSYTISSAEAISSNLTSDKASVNVYNPQSDADSIKIHFQATDSIANVIDTTLYVKFLKRETKPEKFQTSIDAFRVIGTKGIITGKINFNKPLLKINYDSIIYKVDTTTFINILLSDTRYDSATQTLHIEKTFDKTLLIKNTTSPKPDSIKKAKTLPLKTTPSGKPKSKPVTEYELYIGAGTFISVEGDSSIRLSTPLKPTTLETTGVIITEVNTGSIPSITQLLGKSGKVVASSFSKKTTFEDLEPGEYQIRVILDKNDNKQWDPGDFSKNLEPEQIAFYKNEKGLANVNLKANWEIGPLLITH